MISFRRSRVPHGHMGIAALRIAGDTGRMSCARWTGGVLNGARGEIDFSAHDDILTGNSMPILEHRVVLRN